MSIRSLSVQQMNEIAAKESSWVYEAFKKIINKINELVGIANPIFTIELKVSGAGVSDFGLLIGPPVPNLRLIRIAAFYLSGTPTGNTTIGLNRIFGPNETIASLVIPQTWNKSEVIKADFDLGIPEDEPLSLAIAVDGSHRDVYCTATFMQVPII